MAEISKVIGPRNCPIIECTADGRSVGRCWFYLGGNDYCPRHGDVTTAATLYRLSGKLTPEVRPKR